MARLALCLGPEGLAGHVSVGSPFVVFRIPPEAQDADIRFRSLPVPMTSLGGRGARRELPVGQSWSEG